MLILVIGGFIIIEHRRHRALHREDLRPGQGRGRSTSSTRDRAASSRAAARSPTARRRRLNADASRVAIVQSCYIPWKGYFDLINRSTSSSSSTTSSTPGATGATATGSRPRRARSGSRSRSRSRAATTQRIDETMIERPALGASATGRRSRTATRARPHFDDVRASARGALRGSATTELLSDVNRRFLEAICALLGIDTRLTWSTDYEVDGTQDRAPRRSVPRRRARRVPLRPLAPAPTSTSRCSRRRDRARVHGLLRLSRVPAAPSARSSTTVTVLDLLFNTGPRGAART